MFEEGNTDDIFNVFSGATAAEDNFDDVMEEDEYEAEEEQRIEDEKNQAQPVATGIMPPSATGEKRTRKAEEEEVAAEAEKRIRTGESGPAPIVADTFEQETSREVANIAGLQAAAATEGEHITLSHQVNKRIGGSYSIGSRSLITAVIRSFRSGIKSLCHQTTTTFQSHNMFHPKIQHVPTRSRSIRSSA